MAALAPQPPAPPSAEALAGLAGLEAWVRGIVRAEVEAGNARLLEEIERRWDRREQYGTAKELLAAPLPPAADEIPPVEAARLLGLTANTMLQRIYRGADPDLAACTVPGTSGKGLRFSRGRVEALRGRRTG